MAGHSTGTFTIPVAILSGSDALSGIFTVPMFVMEGRSGLRGEPFVIPQFEFTGISISRAMHGEFKIPMVGMSGQSHPLIGMSGSFSIPLPILTGHSSSGSYGTFIIPRFVLFDVSPRHSTGSFELPIPAYTGFTRNVPISKIYRGIVMNISNQAITTYSGFNFNSLAYFNENYYGANEQGIFRLGGNKDNLTRNILAKLKIGAMNFGDGTLKYIRDVWLTYRTDGHLQMTFLVDEDEDITSISQTEYVADNIREERLKCGRGLRGRFYTIVLENLSGADFDIEQLSILVDAARKRVR